MMQDTAVVDMQVGKHELKLGISCMMAMTLSFPLLAGRVG